MSVFRRSAQARWRSRSSLWICGLIALLALTGCGENNCPTCPKPTIVRAQGLQFLRFMQTNPDWFIPQQAQGLFEYTPDSTASGAAASPRILVTLDGYLVVLDPASKQEHLVSNTTCLGRPALSPNHQWLACVSVDGSLSNSVNICRTGCLGTSVSLIAVHDLPNPRPTTIIGAKPTAAANATARYISPAWSPDGRYLAVIDSSVHTPGCTIDLYAANPVRATFTLLNALGPYTSDSQPCPLYQIAWSPASPTLALAQINQSGNTSKASLALLHIPPAALAAPHGAPLVFTAAATPLTLLSAPSTQVTWTSQGQALLVAASNSLTRIDIATGEQSTMLTVPMSVPKKPGLEAIALGADGKTLLLAFGYPTGLTAQRPASAPLIAHAQIPAICITCPGLPVGIYQFAYSAV